MITQRSSLGKLKKLVTRNSSTLASTSASSTAAPEDEPPVLRRSILTAALAAARLVPSEPKALRMEACATPMHASMPAPTSVRVTRSRWAKPLST